MDAVDCAEVLETVDSVFDKDDDDDVNDDVDVVCKSIIVVVILTSIILVCDDSISVVGTGVGNGCWFWK